MEKTLDLSKPLRTEDKREVVIYCTDAPGEYPIHGRIAGEILPSYWTKDGQQNSRCRQPRDLVNVPEKRTVYVYLTTNATGRTYLHAFEKPADSNTFCGPVLASEKIEIVEGQFNADA